MIFEQTGKDRLCVWYEYTHNELDGFIEHYIASDLYHVNSELFNSYEETFFTFDEAYQALYGWFLQTKLLE